MAIERRELHKDPETERILREMGDQAMPSEIKVTDTVPDRRTRESMVIYKNGATKRIYLKTDTGEFSYVDLT